VSPQDIQQLRAQAQAEEQSKGPTASLALVDKALAGASNPPADLWNFAGNIAMRAGGFIEAAKRFGTAATIDPARAEFAINQAIALGRAEDHRGALKALTAYEAQGASDVRYCSVRANAARSAGELNEAAQWYDRALTLDPHHKKAMNGRARVAIERGERDALARFDAALRVDQGNADLWLGKAQSLDVEGDTDGALTIALQLAQQAPSMTEGLRFLAQLRLAAGDEDFAAPYREAASKAPQDPNIPYDHIAQLAGLDRTKEAAEVAAQARARFPQIPFFALLEAVHAGSAGDDDRAEAIFAKLTVDTPERWLNEARHRIRRGEWEQAENELDKVVAQEPWSISAWALRGIVWRITGDERHEWLHGQDGLYRLMPLERADDVLPDAIAKLHELHDGSPFPLGQSLRGGTQTRGRLFQRLEPEYAALKQAIEATLENYRSGLPASDPAHPLLRTRDGDWRILGSWSVRLEGGGDFHTAHIHPQGVISSALYCQLPDLAAGEEPLSGALELGRPPPDLRLDMGPLTTLEPQEGHLALFPSTLYHGTRPFAENRRMSVAFDVVSGE
jgi:tetratricopeptide (TPR) repeat protein